MTIPRAATPGGSASAAFTDPRRGEIYAGKAVTFPLAKRSVPVQVDSEGKVDQRAIVESLRSIDEWMKPFGGAVPELYQMARLLGAAYVTGRVTSGTGSYEDDIVFSHSFDRIPRMVFLSVDLNGTGGQVLGAPPASDGSGGRNATAWTKTAIYVRASVESDYAFLLL